VPVRGGGERRYKNKQVRKTSVVLKTQMRGTGRGRGNVFKRRTRTLLLDDVGGRRRNSRTQRGLNISVVEFAEGRGREKEGERGDETEKQ
jgi:hypothetical protein